MVCVAPLPPPALEKFREDGTHIFRQVPSVKSFSSCQVVKDTVDVHNVWIPFAALVLGRERVLNVKGFFVLQASLGQILDLLRSVGVLLEDRRTL